MAQAAGRQPDSVLCTALAAGVDGGFEALVLAYQDRLYRFALRYSADAQDAEEIVQDALLRAHSALQDYDRQRILALALQAWLYRITVNVARNRSRRKTLPQLSLTPAAGDAGGLPAWREAHEPGPGPEIRVEQAEESAELARLLAALPGRYRSAILLRFVEDMSYQEAAAVLQKPVGTVKSDVHRGLALLREAILAREARYHTDSEGRP